MDPFTQEKEDVRLAYLLMTLNNLTIAVHAKRGTRQTKIDEFLVDWDVTKPKQVKQQSIAEMKEVLKQIAESQNKTTRKRTRKNQ